MIESSTTQPTTTTTVSSPENSSKELAGTTTTRAVNKTSTTKTESTSLLELVSTPQGCHPDSGSKSLYDMVERISGLVSRVLDLVNTYLKSREKDLETPKPVTIDKTPTSPSTPASPSQTAGTPSTQTPTTTSTKKDENECPCIENGCNQTSVSPETSPTTESNQIVTPKELGRSISSSGEFLWKPKSDKDGKLAVLLPKSLAGKIQEVAIVSADKKRVLQRGKYSGVGNGDRSHYRFSKPGGEFPDGSIVWIKLKDGTSRHVVIKNTSARYTK